MATTPWETSRMALMETIKRQTRMDLVSGDNHIPRPNKQLPVATLVNYNMRAKKTMTRRRKEEYILNVISLNACSMRREGRRKIITEKMMENEAHIIGVQEARTEGPTSYDNEHFIMVSGGCKKDTTSHGCELWIRKEIPIKGLDKTVKIDKSQLHVQFTSHRALIATLKSKVISATLVVLHAPHSGHGPEVVEEFWHDMQAKIEMHTIRNLPILVIADTNHQIPEMHGHSGSLSAGQPEDHPLENFIRATDLAIPMTYVEKNTQREMRPTCYTPSEGSAAIDYVMCTRDMLEYSHDAMVDEETDVSISRIDHLMVKTAFSCKAKPVVIYEDRRRLGFDMHKARTEPNLVKDIWRSVPEVPWDVHPDSHLYIINTHVHGALADKFPATRKAPKPTWMKNDTVEAIKKKGRSIQSSDEGKEEWSERAGSC
eukprot:TRINITY_DN38612_c1_g1_i1.p1 TRINITY_DN38612_c1_g1~~TRINITY_DN38612_c1_g1_i1.p1  ORF type:complete len:429 (-),score=80.53 TRINITY_DN38612_c1_g1_i1:1085-2371(-)